MNVGGKQQIKCQIKDKNNRLKWIKRSESMQRELERNNNKTMMSLFVDL